MSGPPPPPPPPMMGGPPPPPMMGRPRPGMMGVPKGNTGSPKSPVKSTPEVQQPEKLTPCKFEHVTNEADYLTLLTTHFTKKLQSYEPTLPEDIQDLDIVKAVLKKQNIFATGLLPSNTTELTKKFSANETNYVQQQSYINRSNYRYLSLIFSFPSENINFQNENINNKFRSMLSVLIDNKIITIDFSCEDTSKFLSGNQLGKDSQSKTLQFINIKPENINTFFKIKINEKEYDELFTTIIDTYADQKKNKCTDKNKLKDNIKENILNTINKLKKNYFLKVGTYEGSSVCDATDIDYSKLSIYDAYNYSFDLNDLLQKNELYLYKLLTKFVFNNNTSHVATHIYDLICKTNEDTKLKDELTKIGRPGKLGYINMMTEMMENSKSLKDVFEKKSYDEIKTILIQTLIQIIYTLSIFERQQLIHADLHSGNIMIETLDNPFTYYYVISNYTDNKKVIKLTSKFFARIYDFDRSYILNDKHYEMVTNEDKQPEDLIKALKERYTQNVKADMFKLKGQLNSQFLDEPKYEKIIKTESEQKWVNDTKIKSLGNGNLSASNYLKTIVDKLPDCMKEYVEIFNDLREIPLTPETCIFFPQTADMVNLLKDISDNESWNKLSLKDKLLVCHPLVTPLDLRGDNGLPDLTC
jgi:hypothetical protein